MSSYCAACGNVGFHAANVSPMPGLREAKQRRAQPRPARIAPATKPASISGSASAPTLAQFRVTPDGNRVQELIFRYQVEWQLWAEAVRHFADPAYHAAYISLAVSANSFAAAAERYREHRSVMALRPAESWQADVADLMLSRLETLSMMRLEQTERPSLLARANALALSIPRPPEWMRWYLWILVGFGLMARFVYPMIR